MKMIIGGYAQGKTEYAKALFKDYVIIDEKEYTEAARIAENENVIINNLHLIVRRCMKLGESLEAMKEMIDQLSTTTKDVILISDEIGSGVIPVEKEERLYREAAGRIMTYAASKSSEVYRVTCGIGVRIK